MLEGTVVDFDAKLTYQAFCRSAATLIVSHPAYDDSPSGFYQRFPTSQEIRKHQETSGNIRKHQETSGKHRCVHMFWPSMFPDFRRKVILHDWLVMSHFSVYETIPARWKGKGDSSNEQLNELKDPEYVPWRFLARLWWSDIQNGV